MEINNYLYNDARSASINFPFFGKEDRQRTQRIDMIASQYGCSDARTTVALVKIEPVRGTFDKEPSSVRDVKTRRLPIENCRISNLPTCPVSFFVQIQFLH